MANLLGYYSGVKEGRETLSKLAGQQSETNLRNLAYDSKVDELAREDQERRLAGAAMNAQIPDSINGEQVSADDRLVMQLTNTAKAVSGVNPKASLEYIKQANDYKAKASENVLNGLKIKSAKMDLQGDLATTVSDQASLDEAIPKFAEVGMVIPERYRTWNPQTADWFARRKIQSSAYIASTKLDMEQLRLEQNDANIKSQIEERTQKAKDRERKDSLMQLKIQTSRQNGLKFANPKEQKAEIKLLSDQDPRFDDLDNELQGAVVKDIHSLAAGYLKDDPTMGQDVALQRARRDALNHIDKDGNYKVIADAPKAGVPELSTWLPAAIKANPTMTEAEIKAIYNDKYGKSK